MPPLEDMSEFIEQMTATQNKRKEFSSNTVAETATSAGKIPDVSDAMVQAAKQVLASPIHELYRL